MRRTTFVALRLRNRMRSVCTAVAPPQLPPPPPPPSSLTPAGGGGKEREPSLPPPPQEPIMPEEYECCGNECGTDCVWSLYFEDQASYLKELKAWELKVGKRVENKREKK